MIEIAVVVIAVALSVAIVLHTKPRGLLISGVILTALLSGVQWEWLNVAGVSLRRACIGLLAVLAIQTTARLPLSVRLLGCASLVGLAGFAGYRPDGSESGLSVTAALLLLHWPAARTIAGWLVDGNGERLGRILVGAAGIHIGLAGFALATFDGSGRFAGAGASSPLFAFNSAALLAALLWGSKNTSQTIRRASSGMIPIMVVLTLLSAQRSGVLLMIAAFAPYATNISFERMKATAPRAILAGGFVWLVTRTTDILDYAFGRFSIRDTSAREERWSATWGLIAERPLFGWGVGFRDTLGFGIHNSYLSVLIELGLVGVGLWLAATAIGLRQAFTRVQGGQLSASRLEILARSWLLVSIAGALVEDKLYRPSNFPAIVFLLGLLLAGTVRNRQAHGHAGDPLLPKSLHCPIPRTDAVSNRS